MLAYKGKEGPCLERYQALVYRGPFRRVEDDDGHSFPRGERIAVCDKTFQLLQREPYKDQFEPIEPREPVSPEAAEAFDFRRSSRRSPHETKGAEYHETRLDDRPACGPTGTCC